MITDKFLSPDKAVQYLQKEYGEYYRIHNPGYVFPEYDLIPLAPKKSGIGRLKAVVKDMDGTTTTTEELCIHSLEYMVRSITARMDTEKWTGLNIEEDYPHIIGNSTTKHVEYLLQKYGEEIQNKAFAQSFMDAVIWTLRFSKDESRIKEVKNDLKNFELQEMIRLISDIRSIQEERELSARFANVTVFSTETQKLRAAITIYYHRYHFILSLIESNNRARLQEELPFMQEDTQLIAPMPGVGIFLALIKGYLSSETIISYALEKWKSHPNTTYVSSREKEYKENFRFLIEYCSAHPVPSAIVTSSIFFEANIVMREVFRILREEVEEYPLSAEEKTSLRKAFTDYNTYYEGFVTATDSSEIRLKPHRDLYCMALHELGIERNDFDAVIGFEDSESGTIAIRAAGIPMSIAVPFYGTEGQDLRAAYKILPGGLLQAIFEYKLFLNR